MGKGVWEYNVHSLPAIQELLYVGCVLDREEAQKQLLAE